MSQFKERLEAATFKILRPLVRMLIRHGFSHSEFSELARRVFVDVGFRDFPVVERNPTVSRVAVLTGLSRKEVLRLKLALESDDRKTTKPINRAVRVVHGWQGDKEFCDKKNRPLRLPLHGEQGSFSTLVKRYSGDITAGAVLDELVRVGAAKLENDRVVLCADGYIPDREIEEQIAIAAMSTNDLLETLDHNLENKGQADKRFQRAVAYHSISPEIAQKFKTLSSEKASSLLVELNSWLAENRNPRTKNAATGKRIGMGIYYFESKSEDNSNDDKKTD